MKLLDHVRIVFVLEGESDCSSDLCDQLRAHHASPVVINLCDGARWRDHLRECLLGLGGARSRLDALVLYPQAFSDDALWRTQDVLVEALERAPCPVAVLAHADGRELGADVEGRRLILADGVPSDPTAVLFDSQVLDKLIDLMPARGVRGPVSAADWLTMALWLSRAVSGTTRCALAWPAFAQSAGHACHA